MEIGLGELSFALKKCYMLQPLKPCAFERLCPET